ncbi:MAG: LuxR C-terminal-related transcriptional regulator [Phenylobacterium sp.]
MHFHVPDIAFALVAASDVASRWRLFTAALGKIGVDQINYGILDTTEAQRLDAPVRFLSTMDPGWLAFYGDRRLDLADPHVAFVREGRLAPYRWGESVLPRIEDGATREVIKMTVDAGLRGQVNVIMADPFGRGVPMSGMTLGSSLREAEFFRAIAGRETELVSLAHLFNSLSIGEARREIAGVKPLSKRERECLGQVAAGRRIDAIADSLGLARVTVELHLRRARRKLRAATLPEAVARGLVFREIDAG